MSTETPMVMSLNTDGVMFFTPADSAEGIGSSMRLEAVIDWSSLQIRFHQDAEPLEAVVRAARALSIWLWGNLFAPRRASNPAEVWNPVEPETYAALAIEGQDMLWVNAGYTDAEPTAESVLHLTEVGIGVRGVNAIWLEISQTQGESSLNHSGASVATQAFWKSVKTALCQILDVLYVDGQIQYAVIEATTPPANAAPWMVSWGFWDPEPPEVVIAVPEASEE